MEFTEFGNQSGKTLMLLPGTACIWQLNFKSVTEELAKRRHIIAVNYDGFEEDGIRNFTDRPTVTEKIANYIIKNHGGRLNGAYGSSLGGGFPELPTQRKRVHIDHAFIGGSDFDQGGKILAGLLTTIVGATFSDACRSKAGREKLKKKLRR